MRRLIPILAIVVTTASPALATEGETEIDPVATGPACLGQAATIVGTRRADVIVGTAGDDVIWASGGRDRIWGLGGNDVICGGHGHDYIDGGPGDDILAGGTGADRIRGGGGNDVVTGGDGYDRLAGNAGDDVLHGEGHTDRLFGGAGNDYLDGGAFSDHLRGGSGFDECHGGIDRTTCEARPAMVRPVDPRVTSYFGWRFHPIYAQWMLHNGWDIDGSCGTPIIAPDAGIVTWAGWMDDRTGNAIRLDHGQGLGTSYAHLSEVAVVPGAVVDQGAVIGYVGTTGASTGCHLHFAMKQDGGWIDPTPYLCPAIGAPSVPWDQDGCPDGV